jgi:outer membrane protein assembly factor BamB
MRKIIIYIIFTTVVFTNLLAQQTGVVTKNQIRLDLRTLGHAPLDVIPPGECAITSLIVGSDGCLYGGTSGTKAHLFKMDPQWGHVFPLGYLAGQESIFHSLVYAPDSSIYIGTSLFNRGAIDERGKDVLVKYNTYQGGHLYRFDPVAEFKSRKRMQKPEPNRPIPFTTDLGIIVPGEGIVCLTVSKEELYGVTFPNAHFFVVNTTTGKVFDKGIVCGPPLHEEPFRSIPKALVIDNKGLVWGACDNGELFHYDPELGKIIHHSGIRLPSELGREFKTILDAAVLSSDGIIYGGTSDGFIFRFDPNTKKISNLGKPMWQYRIRGLAFSKEGDLFGVGGDRGGAARLFVYRTETAEYENLGMLDVNRNPYYSWLAYEIDAMVTGHDGTIFIGESERISHLYLLYPW